jgi:hypothetical protein
METTWLAAASSAETRKNLRVWVWILGLSRCNEG